VVVTFLLFPEGMEALLLLDLETCPASAWAMEQQNLFPDELEITKPKVDARAFSWSDNSFLVE
jgi:hypothetical protein